MTESESAAFDRVREIIARQTGFDPIRITMDSDLSADLGVAGDDGEELFAALDEAFDVDWQGLHLGVHFGDEVWGLPFPWQLKENCAMYVQQPCKVADLVRAVDTGRWIGTKLVRHPKGKWVALYFLSGFQIALLSLFLVGSVWAVSVRLIQ